MNYSSSSTVSTISGAGSLGQYHLQQEEEQEKLFDLEMSKSMDQDFDSRLRIFQRADLLKGISIANLNILGY